MIMQREEVIDVSDVHGLCDGRIRFHTQFIGGATVGVKNEALVLLFFTRVAITLDGAALNSANLMGFFSSKLPQNRHPERSASQTYRKQRALWRGVEGPPAMLVDRCS
jgi:hypothetical protein